MIIFPISVYGLIIVYHTHDVMIIRHEYTLLMTKFIHAQTFMCMGSFTC